jgi:hypothetical protein
VIQARRGKMKFSYYRLKINVFQNRRLDVVEKLHLFGVFVSGLFTIARTGYVVMT